MELLLAIVLIALSGVPGLFLGRDTMRGQWLATLLAVPGSALGLAGVGRFWATGESQSIVLPWSLPGAGSTLGSTACRPSSSCRSC